MKNTQDRNTTPALACCREKQRCLVWAWVNRTRKAALNRPTSPLATAGGRQPGARAPPVADAEAAVTAA